MTPIRFAVLVFLIIFPFQLLFWHTDQFTDEVLWERRTAALYEDLHSAHLDALNPVYSGHPGVSIMSIGALGVYIGLTSLEALRLSVSFLYAAAGALIVTLIRYIYRNTLWWLTVLSLLIFHSSLSSASPTNTVMAPLATSLFLLAWFLYSQERYRHSTSLYVVWGIIIGFAGITRVVSTTLLLLPLTMLLLRKDTWRYIFLSAGIGITTAVLFDPFLWHTPLQHIQHIISGSSINFTETVIDAPLHVRDFILFAPTALLSFVLALVLVFIRNLPKLDRQFLQTALILSVLFAIPFLSVRAQSVRHFMPLIFIWDILLPLQIMWIAKILPFPEQSVLKRALPIASTVVIVTYHIIILFLL